jgi:hypothetical protein
MNTTVIFLTQNNLPKQWTSYHRGVLLEAVGDLPLITVSRKPLDFGLNIIQTEPKSPSNIYWQILKAAKIATTKFIAIAEDDTLYHKDHFNFKLDDGAVGYNMTHWSLFTWIDKHHKEPTYSWRNRRGNYSMKGDREVIIKALEERFAKWPDGTPDKTTGEIGRPMVERNLGVSHVEAVEFYTSIAVVNFNHDYAMDDLQIRHQKGMGGLRAYDIPYWGRAKDLVTNFK